METERVEVRGGNQDITEQYAKLSKIPLGGSNNPFIKYIRNMDLGCGGRYGKKYTKREIAAFLADPMRNEDKLREAVIYIYNASPHFRRLKRLLSCITPT